MYYTIKLITFNFTNAPSINIKQYFQQTILQPTTALWAHNLPLLFHLSVVPHFLTYPCLISHWECLSQHVPIKIIKLGKSLLLLVNTQPKQNYNLIMTNTAHMINTRYHSPNTAFKKDISWFSKIALLFSIFSFQVWCSSTCHTLGQDRSRCSKTGITLWDQHKTLRFS